MILVAAGLPGRFAENCEQLLASLGASGAEPVTSFNADSLSALGAALLERDTGAGMVVTRQPTADLAALFKAKSRPFLIALEPPQDCVAALMADHGLSFLEAVRSTANSCAALFAVLGHPGALVLRQGQTWRDIAQALAAHYHLTLPLDEITRLADRIAQRDSPAVSLHYESPADGLGGLGADALLPSLLESALGPAEAWLDDGELREVVWHRDLFLSGDNPAGPPPPTIDVTGHGRCLFYGPYIRLPPGNWSCALLLGCAADTVGLEFAAEIFAGAVLSRAAFTVTEAGFFEIEFSCSLAGDRPVEIRLFNTKAAFEGHIALVRASLRPHPALRIPVKLG